MAASSISTAGTAMRIKALAAFALCLSLGCGLGMAPASAGDGAPINVNVNMARILRINASAATVIVGNPGIADVTIQDPKTLILTGKSFGQTNLIVLDNAGNPIADTIIEVVQMQAGVTTVWVEISGGSSRRRIGPSTAAAT